MYNWNVELCTAVQSSESPMNQVVAVLTVPNLTLVDVSTKAVREKEKGARRSTNGSLLGGSPQIQ